MKVLFLMIAMSITSVQANCELNLGLKKKTAKTFYLDSGDKLNTKTFKKLSKVCKFNLRVMSKTELKSLKIKELKSKLAKLSK